MMGTVRSTGVASVALLAGVLVAGGEGLASWPQWRGPERDGAAPAFQVPSRWPETLARRWTIEVGLGHASPVIAGGHVFVHARQGEDEVMAAFDAASGKRLWEDRYAAPFTMHPAARTHGPGPKSTPAVADGRVCALGITGVLTCYETGNGRQAWRARPFADQPEFGTAMSPLIDQGLVIVHVGGQQEGALMAFDLASGEERWRWTGDAPAYASPVPVVLDGVRQIVTQSRTHVVSVEASSGKLLWQIPFTTAYDQNSVTPLVVGDLVVYSGISNATTAVRPRRAGTEWRLEEVWKNDEVPMYMSSPVLFGSQIVGLSHRNRGQFFSVDAKTGRTLWRTQGRSAEHAALVKVDGVVLALTTNGELIVFEPGAEAFTEARRYRVSDEAVWAHPALDGRAIFVKDHDSLAAWEVSE